MNKATRILMLAFAVAFAACSKDAATPPTDDDDDNGGGGPGPVGNISGVIVGAGNICGPSNFDELTAKLIDTMTTATVVALGNAANGPSGSLHGTAATYASCYEPTWGRFKSRTYYAMGNHDYDTTNAANDAFAYWGDRAGPSGLGYYSFDVGAWHVVVLNTENAASVPYGASSDQQAWLGTDLLANTKKCVMAIYHRTRFQSTSQNGSSGSPFFERTTLSSLWGRLAGGGVDVILNGGNYFYERMKPMNAAGNVDDAAGIVQFNVGTGGEQNPLVTPAMIHPNSAKLGTDHGVLKLTLRDNGYDYAFMPVAGASFTDTGSRSCQ